MKLASGNLELNVFQHDRGQFSGAMKWQFLISPLFNDPIPAGEMKDLSDHTSRLVASF
jgi:hypothetical protein